MNNRLDRVKSQTWGNTRKPIPIDAVFVVAAKPRDANMRKLVKEHGYANCRDCNEVVIYRKTSKQFAMHRADVLGDTRPIEFLCVDCFVKYSRDSVDEIHDLREPDNGSTEDN